MVWGYTLIELTLVILLISVLIGLSTPLFRRTFSELELKNTSYDLAKLINYAQALAVADGASYRMNFNFDKGQYWITKVDTKKETEAYVRIKDRYGRVFSVPEGYTLEAKEKLITFYPDGHCDKTVLKVLDPKGRGYAIIAEKSGNHVEVKVYEGEK